jgi:hypothetical protein
MDFKLKKIEKKINGFFENNFFFLNFLRKYLKQHIKTVKEVNQITKNNNLKKLEELNISSHKKSDTLFILGSGASINDFSDDDWDIISNNNSIGFNFWLIHDFVPDFYCFEPPPNELRNDVFYKLLNLKRNEYNDIPFILRHPSNINFKEIPNNIIDNLYLPYTQRIYGSSLNNLKQSISYLDKFGFFNIDSKIKYLLRKRSSLTVLLSFGFFAGYNKIVLCGVDLNNTKYFYTEDNLYYKKKGVPIPPNKQKGKIHKTIDPSYGDITIDNIIYNLNKLIFEEQNIRLFIGSKKSALYPMLPYYFE